ncbi:MAG TPA: porin family protein [Pontibacter sp.]
MRKLLFLFAFVLVATFSAQAQVGIGLRVGANYSGLRGDDAGDPERIFGAHAGLTANFPISADNFFAIQPALLFSMKGAKNNNTDLRIYYIDVPVLARINAAPLYFEFGPQLSVNVGDNVDVDGSNDGYRRAGLGYAAGLGIGTPMGVSLGVRYNGDISKVYDVGDAKIYNDVFMLTLGYTFGSR